jgi:hypothetical protein
MAVTLFTTAKPPIALNSSGRRGIERVAAVSGIAATSDPTA